MPEDVELSIQGQVAFVRLHRPDRGNALRGTTFDELRKIGLKLADSPPKFLVLTGAGEDFCSGLDVDPADGFYKVFEPLVRARDAHRAQEVVKQVRGSIELFGRLPCPVIAAVEGRCQGAGLELALTADLRVAARDATFRLGEGRLGMLPGLGGLVRATLALGPTRAQDLALTGRSMAADEAHAAGLVTRLAEPGSALATAIELVEELRRNAPTARLQGLLALRAIHHRMAQELFDHEQQAAARTWIAGEWAQGLAAAKDGREPAW